MLSTKLIASLTAATTAVVGASPAFALRVHPNLFAREYCSLRSVGVSHRSSIEGAMDTYSYPGEPVKVTREDGSTTDLDTVQAVSAMIDRCPELIPN